MAGEGELYTLVAVIATLFIVMGLFLGYILFNPIQKIKMRKMITGKNYGFIYLRSKGRTLVQLIRNFDKDFVVIGKARFIIKGATVYRVMDESKGTVKKTHKILPEYIDYQGGIPTIFVNIEDLVPQKFVFEENPTGIMRDPFIVESGIQKEISAIEAEALKMHKSKIMSRLMILLLISLVTIVAVVGLYYMLAGIGDKISFTAGAANETLTVLKNFVLSQESIIP